MKNNPFKWLSITLGIVILVMFVSPIVRNSVGGTNLKEQMQEYDSTLHQEYHAEVIRWFTSNNGLYAYTAARKLEVMLRNASEYWSSLRLSGELDAKRNNIVGILNESQQKASGMTMNRVEEGDVEGMGDDAARLGKLTNDYWKAYEDFLRTAFPDGEVRTSYGFDEILRRVL